MFSPRVRAEMLFRTLGANQRHKRSLSTSDDLYHDTRPRKIWLPGATSLEQEGFDSDTFYASYADGC